MNVSAILGRIPLPWWLNQPIWKICASQIASFPQKLGWTQKNLRNHHPAKKIGKSLYS